MKHQWKRTKSQTRVLQHKKTTEELRSSLDCASKFDFVGGGVNEIAGSDLAGAKMELKRISDAIENGIKKFPLLECYVPHLKIFFYYD